MSNKISFSSIYVYVMFGRSYDKSTINGGVHLISSAYCQPILFNFAQLGELLSSKEGSYYKGLLTSSGQYIVVRIINDLTPEIEDAQISPEIKTVNHRDSVIEFIIPVSI